MIMSNEQEFFFIIGHGKDDFYGILLDSIQTTDENYSPLLFLNENDAVQHILDNSDINEEVGETKIMKMKEADFLVLHEKHYGDIILMAQELWEKEIN
jgi:hypothetical protein